AVAVCCRSDSRSSLSRRVFSNAMTARCGKMLTNSICFLEDGRGTPPYMLKVTITPSSFRICTTRNQPAPPRTATPTQLRMGLPVGVGLLQIGNMDDLLRLNGPARTCFWIKGVRTALPEFDKRW